MFWRKYFDTNPYFMTPPKTIEHQRTEVREAPAVKELAVPRLHGLVSSTRALLESQRDTLDEEIRRKQEELRQIKVAITALERADQVLSSDAALKLPEPRNKVQDDIDAGLADLDRELGLDKILGVANG